MHENDETKPNSLWESSIYPESSVRNAHFHHDSKLEKTKPLRAFAGSGPERCAKNLELHLLVIESEKTNPLYPYECSIFVRVIAGCAGRRPASATTLSYPRL